MYICTQLLHEQFMEKGMEIFQPGESETQLTPSYRPVPIPGYLRSGQTVQWGGRRNSHQTPTSHEGKPVTPLVCPLPTEVVPIYRPAKDEQLGWLMPRMTEVGFELTPSGQCMCRAGTYVTFLKVQTAILLSRPAENYRKNEFKKFNFFRSFFEKCQKNFYKIIFFFAFQTCHGWRRSLKKKFLKSVKKWQIVDRSRWAIFDNLFYF